MHPAGAVARPPVCDGSRARVGEGGAELVVIAPAAAADRAAERAAAAGAAALTEAGVAYVFAPPRSRLRLLRLLRREGLLATAAFVHVRGTRGDDLLVQLEPRALRYAADALVGAPAALRAAVRVLPPRGLSPAAVLAPRVGVAVRRRDAPPLAAWLRATSGAPPEGLILRRVRTRDEHNLFAYALGDRPIIVKVRDGTAETDGLAQHGAAAARAGAAVAEAVDLAGGPPGAAALTLLEGVAASTVLERRPAELAGVIERVTGWLARWNLETAAASVVTERLLEDELLAPARLLESTLRDGTRYRAWLEERSSAWIGAELPLVAAHLDLTMANVLLGRDGGIGVVDWAQARENRLPLTDFFYAVTDAAAAVAGYRDRLAAFRSCFAGGAHSTLARHLERVLAESLGVSPAVCELCFHACWLHHAANELRQRPDGPAPFVEIVDAVAAEASASAPV